MIRIETVKLEYLNYIENIANSSSEYLVPNNHMIYYLCCTVFSKYSFIAFKNDAPIGYLFSVPEFDAKYIWLHQIAVTQENRHTGVGSQLVFEFEKLILKEKCFKTIRCAIKPDNLPSKTFFLKHSFKSLGLDSYISMEIFEKQI